MFLSLALAAGFALPAAGQVVTAPPVRMKVKQPKQKVESFKGEVFNFTNVAITVRDTKNFALLRTFSYSPELTRKLENRYMEPGDRITVRFVSGNTAIALKGKLRKADLPLQPVKARKIKN